jgi:MFS family permease
MLFALNSFMFGNWVTRIPDVTSKLELSESELGTALLGAPVGALLVMPFAGVLIARLGLGKTVYGISLIHIVTLIGMALATNQYLLTASLFLYGLTTSLMDISMNTAASQIELKIKKSIMSTCHGMWSLGALLGAGVGGFFVEFQINLVIHLGLIVVFMLVLVFSQTRMILQFAEIRQSTDKHFAWPRGTLLILAFMAFFILMSEGAIADWSALYMRNVLDNEGYALGGAYAVFSLAMMMGRLLGDGIIPRVGHKRMLMGGSFLSFLGLLLVVTTSSTGLAIFGFGLTGMGYSVIVPILFLAAANYPGYSAGSGIAAVSTLGYTGFLIGPPLIGYVADWYGLRWGMSFIMIASGMIAVVAVFSRFNTRSQP